METKKIKAAILLIGVLLNCNVAFSENIWPIPLNVSYSSSPIFGTHRPHKAPLSNNVTLRASYDADNVQLIFNSTQGIPYNYAILDINKNTISEGYLDFGSYDCIYENLSWLQLGAYTLIVYNNEEEFHGTFEI